MSRTFENPWYDDHNPSSPAEFEVESEPVGHYGQGVFYKVVSEHQNSVVLVVNDKYAIGQYVTVEGGIRAIKRHAGRVEDPES